MVSYRHSKRAAHTSKVNQNPCVTAQCWESQLLANPSIIIEEKGEKCKYHATLNPKR